MSEVETGSIYTHDQSRNEYVVSMVARNPNTLKLVVIYFARDNESKGGYYWRPLQEFRTKFTKKRGGSTDG